ncbi:MAG: hypothetical protein LC754_04580 [Acidobacteria bacterium]|nr:hypothetical protein [Acidobacteriota bacterium]
MTYQVIARKWRPQTFEDVTGQEGITRTLRNAIEHERLHHAYLFSGARGVGKTTTARLLAKAVNCHRASGPTPTPCAFTDPDACPSCREIAEGRSIDVLEIDAASNTGVDNVRDAIINTIGVRPARDRYNARLREPAKARCATRSRLSIRLYLSAKARSGLKTWRRRWGWRARRCWRA